MGEVTASRLLAVVYLIQFLETDKIISSEVASRKASVQAAGAYEPAVPSYERSA